MGFGGLNLTIPLKERALQVVKPVGVATVMGAVNTVDFQNGIWGYNTDGIGALMALETAGINIRDRRVLIIGAGGAAKAIAYQLGQEGAYIVIANRNVDRALALAQQVNGRGFGLDDLDKLVPESDLIINATSVGMRKSDPPLLNGRLLSSDHAVFDIIYNRETQLLRDADRVGATTVDGVMMLVYQGSSAIKIWTGLDAPVEVMERAVREELKKK
jgi:shikimate dehydrogenase